MLALSGQDAVDAITQGLRELMRLAELEARILKKREQGCHDEAIIEKIRRISPKAPVD